MQRHKLRSEHSQLPQSMQQLPAGVKFDQEHPAVVQRHMEQKVRQQNMLARSSQEVGGKQPDTVIPQQHDKWIPQASLAGRGLAAGGRWGADRMGENDLSDSVMSLHGNSVAPGGTEQGQEAEQPSAHNQAYVVHAGLLGWKLTDQVALEEEAELEPPFGASEHHGEQRAMPNWQARSHKAAVDAVRRNQERWPLWAKRVDYHVQRHRQPASSHRSPKASRARFAGGNQEEHEQYGQRPAAKTRRPQPPQDTAWGDAGGIGGGDGNELYLQYLAEKSAWM